MDFLLQGFGTAFFEEHADVGPHLDHQDCAQAQKHQQADEFDDVGSGHTGADGIGTFFGGGFHGFGGGGFHLVAGVFHGGDGLFHFNGRVGLDEGVFCRSGRLPNQFAHFPLSPFLYSSLKAPNIPFVRPSWRPVAYRPLVVAWPAFFTPSSILGLTLTFTLRTS